MKRITERTMKKKGKGSPRFIKFFVDQVVAE